MTRYIWLDAMIILGGVALVLVLPAVAICILNDWLKARSRMEPTQGFEVKPVVRQEKQKE